MKITRQGSKFVAISSFEEKDVLKAAGFRWDPEARRWWTDKPEVAGKLWKYADDAAKAELLAAEGRRESSLKASHATDAAIDAPAPEGLAYLPFQKAGIAYATERSNTLIADSMGLGKTIQAIGVINSDPSIRRVLVICPASLKLNWERELRKWLVRSLGVGIANGGGLPSTDVVIINYDILKKHHDALRAVAWDLLISDESHYLKNADAQRTQEVVGKRKQNKATGQWGWAITPLEARRKLLLTGTPILNRPIEIFELIRYLDPQRWPSRFGFGKRYCAGFQNHFGWDFTGASHLDELQEKLRTTLMIRRTKEQVLAELPPKRRQIIELSANGAQAAIDAESQAYAEHEMTIEALALAAELAKAGDEETYKQAVAELNARTRVAFTEISEHRHQTALAKVPAVVAHIKDVLEGTDDGYKLVVMAHHHDVQDAILAEFGDIAVLHRGGLSDTEKQAAVDRFMTDPRVRLFVGSIQASGVGITLTAAAHMIFAELDWVPGNVTQAEDRIHRIGQTGSVLIQHLVFDRSLDAKMAKTLVAKQAVIDAALDDDLPALPEITEVEANRKQIEQEAETMTPEQVAAIHTGLKVLAAMDLDRAAELNGVGYSKFDTGIGHALAGAVSLTPKQAALGKRLLQKYRRQLPEDLLDTAAGKAA